MNQQRSRREFLTEVAAIASAATAVRNAEGRAADTGTGTLPKIKLGTLKVSRLILGSNPFFGFSHGNPQASPEEMQNWYTPERVMSVLDQAAEHGITAVWTPCYEHWVEIWNEYRQQGGKLPIWIAQPDRLPMEREIEIAVKNGICVGMFPKKRDEIVENSSWTRNLSPS